LGLRLRTDATLSPYLLGSMTFDLHLDRWDALVGHQRFKDLRKLFVRQRRELGV
jgi:hypothetical protein